MDSQKCLIIVTLLDGQNFTVPDGAPEKIEASVYAEARFGNESILKSDPIKLTNSNPEFVTELAWQLDKKSLHQLRVERRAIKLQVFLQTQERKRASQCPSIASKTNGFSSNELTHKVELVGYTVIDIRSAQECEKPKFRWLPLLNPKFRKSSYNRPEIQLALSLSRLQDNANSISKSLKSSHTESVAPNETEAPERTSFSESDSLSGSSYLYKTCLDFTHDSGQVENDEIIENDINIEVKNGCIYIYDIRDPEKSTLQDCSECYKLTITIPFTSDLNSLVKLPDDDCHFSVAMFGTLQKTDAFKDLSKIGTKELCFLIYTTHSSILKTYLELNSGLLVKLNQSSGEPLGITTIQLDQLCSLDIVCRSIEGIFALQPVIDTDIPLAINPTIGVSVVLERTPEDRVEQTELIKNKHNEVTNSHYGDRIDDRLYETLNDTHQLTIDHSIPDDDINSSPTMTVIDGLRQDDHHFCFTIDLKNFSYTPEQRFIPTLRELVVRYSYPFFGYKDTITSDASIPISPTNSIIVSGFCEFNFATTIDALLTALTEIPLNLEIISCDKTRPVDTSSDSLEHVVATCSLDIAKIMNLDSGCFERLRDQAISTTVSAPIYRSNGEEIGELQIYLCLRDLGFPKYLRSSERGSNIDINIRQSESAPENVTKEMKRLDSFIANTKKEFELWRENCYDKLFDELIRKDSERFRKLYQRLEAKEARRDQEFRKKLDELTTLERKFKNSLNYIESLEKKLANNLEQLKAKDAIIDGRLETMDLKLSRAVQNLKLECDKKLEEIPSKYPCNSNRMAETRINMRQAAKSNSEMSQQRRSSLKNPTSAGIPVPIRSSSLVRGPLIDNSTTRFVKRPTSVITTVVNGFNPKPRSNSTKLNLSKETQEKLASLRREKAELLKRGCRPNDDLIQEINSLIEKLAY